MIRVTSFVHLARGASPGDVSKLLDVVHACGSEIAVLAIHAARTDPVAIGGGDIMIVAAFADMRAYRAASKHAYVTTVVRPLLDRVAIHVESVRYAQGAIKLRNPGIAKCVHRTLLLRVDPAAAALDLAMFERALADMGRYITVIRNSSLSKVDRVFNPRSLRWMHVWERSLTRSTI